MSVKSSQSVNPPVPCEGITFAYPSGYVPTPATGQLGATNTTTSGAITTPISGANQDQIYLTAGSIGAGLQAGTHIAYSVATLINMSGLFNSYIQVVDASDGTTIITESAGSYIQEQQDPSLSISTCNYWCFTSPVPCMVYSRLATESGGGGGTPTDNGSLQVIRIA